MRKVHPYTGKVVEKDPKTVNVHPDPSGMGYTHDYACPVCSKNHANLNLACSAFMPCDDCKAKGWVLTCIPPQKKLTFWQRVQKFLRN